MRFTEPVLAQVLDDTDDGQAGEPGKFLGNCFATSDSGGASQTRRPMAVSPGQKSFASVSFTIYDDRHDRSAPQQLVATTFERRRLGRMEPWPDEPLNAR